jgi:hypothetical protein
MKPLELKPMMNESNSPMEENRDIEVTLKREMFPDGARFWDDDGTPKVTTPDGRVLFVVKTDVFTDPDPRLPDPHAPFVREVAWEEFAEVRDKYLRMASSSTASAEENSFTDNDPKSITQLKMKQETKEPPKPKPKGPAGQTWEEQLAAHNRGMAEWKAKHGDKAPKVH